MIDLFTQAPGWIWLAVMGVFGVVGLGAYKRGQSRARLESDAREAQRRTAAAEAQARVALEIADAEAEAAEIMRQADEVADAEVRAIEEAIEEELAEAPSLADARAQHEEALQWDPLDPL